MEVGEWVGGSRSHSEYFLDNRHKICSGNTSIQYHVYFVNIVKSCRSS